MLNQNAKQLVAVSGWPDGVLCCDQFAYDADVEHPAVVKTAHKSSHVPSFASPSDWALDRRQLVGVLPRVAGHAHREAQTRVGVAHERLSVDPVDRILQANLATNTSSAKKLERELACSGGVVVVVVAAIDVFRLQIHPFFSDI